MKFRQVLEMTLCLIALPALASAAPILHFEIYADSTLAGQPGFLMNIDEPGASTETLFLYQSAGRVRVLASREDLKPGWEFYAPNVYLAPALSDGPGTSWAFIPNEFDGTLTVTLESFGSVEVRAGTFNVAQCIARPDAAPGTDLELLYFAAGVGLVYETYLDELEEIVLQDYSLVGGSGYFPLAVGNWWEFAIVSSSVGGVAPPVHLLRGNVPNPFNPVTEIAFELAADAHARLAVYDAAGHLVKVLVDEWRAAGPHRAVWQGMDAAGRKVAAGVYWCRFEAGGLVQSRAMTLVN
jgi:hypothetical protein